MYSRVYLYVFNSYVTSTHEKLHLSLCYSPLENLGKVSVSVLKENIQHVQYIYRKPTLAFQNFLQELKC